MVLRPLAPWLPVAATVAIRLVVIAVTGQTSEPWLDPDNYLARAIALNSGAPWMSALTDIEGLIVPPLYSAFLAVMLRFGVEPLMMLVVQCALAGVACAALVHAATLMAGKRGAIAAGWLFALMPSTVMAAPAFWSEALFVPLWIGGVALLVEAVSRPTARAVLLAGIVLAAAALTRSIAVFATPMMLLPLVSRAPGRRVAIQVGVVFVAIVGAYVAIASMQSGRLVIVDNSAEWHWTGRTNTSVARSSGPSSVPVLIVREFSHAPFAAGRESLARVRVAFSRTLWNRPSWLGPTMRQVLEMANVLLLAVMVAGAACGFSRHRRDPRARVLLACVAAQILLISLSAANSSPRYRAPIEPVLLVLAAAAIPRV